ncbi:hypothetical protein C7H19_15860 [Aphanothece hegewaldii CCALA 016]|uniref:Uncharacterized protein n=2 Tax=Aphanothece TaxID=1121 RepID=A0A2T1LVR3_9CHRO|nr:hypothetical protein C7H19_15860 [Aphanothece hegewaldii CCALA 016]
MGVALGLSLSFWTGHLTHAQSLRPEYVANIVYQRLPEIPKENQYIRQSTKEVDPDNTLISRLIRYNQDVQKRPVRYRLDWKLAFADYLGANEPVKEERYPGRNTLTVNPYKKDLEVIRSLNRRQRNELVNIIASVYNPPASQSETPQPTPQSSPQPTPQPSPPTAPQKPTFSQPGDSQLLKP